MNRDESFGNMARSPYFALCATRCFRSWSSMIATYCNILQQLYKYRKYHQISITLCLPHCLLCLHFDMETSLLLPVVKPKRTDIIAQRVLFVRTLAFHRWVCLLLNSVPALRLTLTHQSSLRLFQSQLSQAKKSQYTVYVCLLLTTLETAESASQCAGPVQHSRYAFERSLNPWVLNGADSISHAQSSGIPEKD